MLACDWPVWNFICIGLQEPLTWGLPCHSRSGNL